MSMWSLVIERLDANRLRSYPHLISMFLLRCSKLTVRINCPLRITKYAKSEMCFIKPLRRFPHELTDLTQVAQMENAASIRQL